MGGIFVSLWFTDLEFAASGVIMMKVFAWSLPLLLCPLCIAEIFAKRLPEVKAQLLNPSGLTIDALIKLPIEELKEWLSTESAIGASTSDFFGAEERARQVWNALRTRRRDGSGHEFRQTVVIQGPFGAGKTSVVRLVENLASESEDERYIFAHVNCWGFSSIAAQEHILERAIEELSQTVDCLALRRLPAAYANTIRESNSWFSLLTYITGEEKEPAVQLRRFTPLLRAIAAQLVIVIEDTDRNGPDFDQKHIEAMLYRFREVERVSFILTAGSKSDIDFPKIAEHISFISPLRVDAVLALVNRIRDYCFTNWIFIDPTAGPYSSRNRPKELQNGVPPWALPLVGILSNPRRLKKTLSEILTRWDVLNGEVDLDELIMLTALRQTAPRVFSFFGSHFQEFKSVTTVDQSPYINRDREVSREGRLAFLKERWRIAVSELEDDSKNLAAILAELIWSSTGITNYSGFHNSNRFQSINANMTKSRSNVYWERLSSGAVPPNIIRDQEVLKALQNIGQGVDTESFGQRFAKSNEFAELVLFFENEVRGVSDQVILAVATAVIKTSRPMPVDFSDSDAFENLQTLLKRFSTEDPDYQRWVTLEIENCFPDSLLDAEKIFWKLGKEKLHGAALMAIRQSFVKCVRMYVSKVNADVFASYFSISYPYSLAAIFHMHEKSSSPEFLTRPSDWIWISDLLIESMSKHPQVMVPQVIMLFGEYGPGGQHPTFFKYDEAKYSELFRERWPEVLRFFTQEIVVSDESEGWFRLAAALATAEAKRLAVEV